MTETVLRVDGLTVEYLVGLRVVDQLSLSVTRGEVVGLFGRNGSGKSTALKAVFGLVPRWVGTIELVGRSIAPGTASHALARLGATMVIEGRGIFPDLTVEENLRAGIRTGKPQRRLARAYERFPMLAPKKAAPAGRLSGGEQQLLAIARASMLDPKLLILDEPSLGLSPAATAIVMNTLRLLAAEGSGVLIADQNYVAVNRTCSRAYLMANGRIVDATNDLRSKTIQWVENVYLVQGG